MKLDINFKITDIKIGKLLRIKREQLGWSQAKVAKKLGVCHSAIEHKEAGNRGFTLDFLKRWCDVLGLVLVFDIKLKRLEK